MRKLINVVTITTVLLSLAGCPERDDFDDSRGGPMTSAGGNTTTTNSANQISSGTSGATPINVGSSVAGRLDGGNDVDEFTFSAQSGRRYIVETTGPTDTLLELRIPGGQRLNDDDSGTEVNARIEFTVSSSGACHIEVSGFSGETGPYSILVSFGNSSSGATGGASSGSSGGGSSGTGSDFEPGTYSGTVTQDSDIFRDGVLFDSDSRAAAQSITINSQGRVDFIVGQQIVRLGLTTEVTSVTMSPVGDSIRLTYDAYGTVDGIRLTGSGEETLRWNSASGSISVSASITVRTANQSPQLRQESTLQGTLESD